jgi:hypothetical protein
MLLVTENVMTFDEYLDEIYAPYSIMGMEIPASKVLKECDPIAYSIAEYEYSYLEEQCDD